MSDAFRGEVLLGFDTRRYRSRRGDWVDNAVLSGHDRLAAHDYSRAAALGVTSVREGARWPAVERQPWQYDFGVLARRVREARARGLRIVWSLLDGDWPDDVDPMRPEFVRRFAGFARAFARFLRDECEPSQPQWIVPVEQIGVRAWRGGAVAHGAPYLEERGFELQVQLVRAALAATDALRIVIPQARMLCLEPLFHVAAHPDRPHEVEAALAATARRNHAIDMLLGRRWPQLGGEPRHVDIVGLTYYPDHQWYYAGPAYPGPAIPPGAPGWRPVRELLLDVAQRHERRVLVAETGRDGPLAAIWFCYVCSEVRRAMLAGATVAGVGVYPAVACPPAPGERRPAAGIWGNAHADGRRPVNKALAKEVSIQCGAFARMLPEPRVPAPGAGDASVAVDSAG